MDRIELSRNERAIIALKKFGWNSDFKKKYDHVQLKTNSEKLIDDLLDKFEIPKYK